MITAPAVVDGLVAIDRRSYFLRLPPELLVMHPALEETSQDHLDGGNPQRHWDDLLREATRLRDMIAFRRELIREAADPSLLQATLYVPMRTIEEVHEYLARLVELGEALMELEHPSFVFRIHGAKTQLLVAETLADLTADASLVPTTVISNDDLARVVREYS